MRHLQSVTRSKGNNGLRQRGIYAAPALGKAHMICIEEEEEEHDKEKLTGVG